jgi:phosphatidate cytidylyltransferase
MVHAILFTHHNLISSILCWIIFLLFVFSLRTEEFRYQFNRLGIALISALVVAEAVKSFTDIYFYGIFWAIFLPVIVGVNDSWAYLSGMTFGKHPLIILSPKKTQEGFLGGAVFTLIFTFIFVSQIFRFEQLTCPTKKVSIYPFEPLDCVPSKVFDLHFVEMPLFGMVQVCDAQLACCVFGLFTSLVAPFAGFLASGIKRAYHLKDFGTLVPGHGGIIDRYDCSIACALFASQILGRFLYSDEFLVESITSRLAYSNFPTDQIP